LKKWLDWKSWLARIAKISPAPMFIFCVFLALSAWGIGFWAWQALDAQMGALESFDAAAWPETAACPLVRDRSQRAQPLATETSPPSASAFGGMVAWGAPGTQRLLPLAHVRVAPPGGVWGDQTAALLTGMSNQVASCELMTCNGPQTARWACTTRSGQTLAEVLVGSGLATVRRSECNAADCASLLALQPAAATARRGIWWDWRGKPNTIRDQVAARLTADKADAPSKTLSERSQMRATVFVGLVQLAIATGLGLWFLRFGDVSAFHARRDSDRERSAWIKAMKGKLYEIRRLVNFEEQRKSLEQLAASPSLKLADNYGMADFREKVVKTTVGDAMDESNFRISLENLLYQLRLQGIEP
jgi:hypothetical protein